MMTTDWFEGQQSNGLYVTMANISARGGKYDGDSDVAVENNYSYDCKYIYG